MFDRIELRPYYRYISINNNNTNLENMWKLFNPSCGFYTHRKIELLTPEWPTDIELEYMQIAAAPYGGPLATIRDARKLVPVKGTYQDVIRIFDTTGTEMGHIPVSNFESKSE